MATAAACVTWVGAQTRVSPTAANAGRRLFAAPEGLPTNDGSVDRPLDLATALSNNSPLRSGDVLWLRGGTYRGTFVSVLSGTPGLPITVRGAPGERAIIDGRTNGAAATVLTVRGAWTVYRDFEVTNSDQSRTLSAAEFRGSGVDILGPNTSFVNLIVHDTGGGFGLWTEAENAELRGSIVFNNGWEGPDRGHGHGVYAQNKFGIKRITDNIIFNQFSHGLHVFGSSAASLDNFDIEGNVLFNNGAPSRSGNARNILVGGGTIASHLRISSNFTYYPEGTDGENNLGYHAGCRDAAVTGNYFAGRPPLALVNCSDIAVRGNVLMGAVADAFRSSFPDNEYRDGRPRENQLIVRTQRDDPTRGLLVVYNWTGASSVVVDLAELPFRTGTEYDIYDAQDPFSPPVLSGVIDGRRVIVPIVARPVPQPIGNAAVRLTSTAPDFLVFTIKARTAVPKILGKS